MLRYSTRIHFLALAAVLFLASPAPAETLIQPAERGPYPVGATNYQTQDSPVLSDAQIVQLLNRTAAQGGFIADILQFPESTETFEVKIPQIPALYGNLGGQSMTFSGFVMYPTISDNPRPSYTFPLTNAGDVVFERMEAPTDEPIFHDPHLKYPLIVLSHGGGVHALYEVSHAKFFASHGYIVACLNYGDGPVDTRRNEFYGLRPLATKAFIDRLLSGERFGNHIDRQRIGISGHSWGGLTALATAGAKLFNHADAVVDPRIKAVVGLEPSITNNFGGNFRYSFGPNNTALRSVRQPYLHINGTVNTLPLPALDLVSGSTYSVTLPGQPHVFAGPSWLDAHNWELVFFNAYLKDDLTMLELLRTAVSVDGYNEDFQDFKKQKIIPPPPASATLVAPRLSIVETGSPPTAHVQASFLVATADAHLLEFDLQASLDGRHWSTIATQKIPSTSPLRLPSAPDGYAWQTLRDPRPIYPASPARFLRLRRAPLTTVL